MFQKLLAELENEEIPSYIREARLASLKQQASQFRDMHEKGYGNYRYNPNKSFVIVSVINLYDWVQFLCNDIYIASLSSLNYFI